MGAIGSFVAIALTLFAGVGILKFGTATYENLTNGSFIDNVSNFFLDIQGLFNAVGDIFKAFLDILPGQVGAIFVLFFSIMIPFLLYKLYKGGGS